MWTVTVHLWVLFPGPPSTASGRHSWGRRMRGRGEAGLLARWPTGLPVILTEWGPHRAELSGLEGVVKFLFPKVCWNGMCALHPQHTWGKAWFEIGHRASCWPQPPITCTIRLGACLCCAMGLIQTWTFNLWSRCFPTLIPPFWCIKTGF